MKLFDIAIVELKHFGKDPTWIKLSTSMFKYELLEILVLELGYLQEVNFVQPSRGAPF